MEIYSELVQLARLALTGTDRDVVLYLRLLCRRLAKESPESAVELERLLSSAPTRGSVTRRSPAAAPPPAIPVDLDSRMDLARPEYPVTLGSQPLWQETVEERLQQVILEREREQELRTAGLLPTKSVLFTGPPGVGKSLAARWIASKLDKPLLTLSLSAVMSSYLGRTGSNLRQVIEHAKAIDCVLFLDELDAVAKRRDDEAEIGELKRLVTVLLQEIDAWPASGLLLAATNHPDLLDRAVWRRFDIVVDFPMPTSGQILSLVQRFLSPSNMDQKYIEIVATSFAGRSFCDVEKEMLRAQREAVLSSKPMAEILPAIVRHALAILPRADRIDIAANLRAQCGLTERDARLWTGVSRETIRKATKAG